MLRKQLHVVLGRCHWCVVYCKVQIQPHMFYTNVTHTNGERERERESSGNGECRWRGSEQQASDIQGLFHWFSQGIRHVRDHKYHKIEGSRGLQCCSFEESLLVL